MKKLGFLVITRDHGSFEGRHQVEILPTGLPELSKPARDLLEPTKTTRTTRTTTTRTTKTPRLFNFERKRSLLPAYSYLRPLVSACGSSCVCGHACGCHYALGQSVSGPSERAWHSHTRVLPVQIFREFFPEKSITYASENPTV